MSSSGLKSLFGYKSWANAELFELLATLRMEQSEVLHSCIRTLNRSYVVDRIFRSHLSGERHSFEATNTSETPSLAWLREAVAVTDAWYEDYASRLSADELDEDLDFTFTDGDMGRMSREEILLHVVVHGGYHRGNVGQILRSISVAPPRDLYTRYLHLTEPGRRERGSSSV